MYHMLKSKQIYASYLKKIVMADIIILFVVLGI